MRILSITVLALFMSTGVAGAADPRFEFLERLEGTWTTPPEEGNPPRTFEFRVTAGGSAVEEREMVGTPMEMVTLYYLDGEDLAATHYCMIGNRPQLTASKTLENGTLRFSCAGKPGGAASHDEEHVHGWTMKLDQEGRLHYAAELVKDGAVSEAPAFVLTRQTETASR